jgi:hypothetical protein
MFTNCFKLIDGEGVIEIDMTKIKQKYLIDFYFFFLTRFKDNREND